MSYLIVLILLLPLSLAVGGFGMRYWLRDRVRQWRIQRAGGGFYCYRLIPQALTAKAFETNEKDQRNAWFALIDNLNPTGHPPYSNRPAITCVINRPEDGQVNLYIATTRNLDDSVIRNFANSLNCGFAEVDDLPDVYDYDLAYAVRQQLVQGGVNQNDDQGLNAGGAIKYIADKAADRDRNFIGTVMLTLEGSRNFATTRYETNFNESAAMTGGRIGVSGGSRTGDRAQHVKRSICLGSMAATASRESSVSAQSALKGTLAAMKSLPTTTEVTRNPFSKHQSWSMLYTGLYLLFGTGIVWLGSALGASLLWPVLVVSLPAILGGAAGMISLDSVTRQPYLRMLRRGEVTVPPTWYLSARWFVQSRIRARKHDGNDPNAPVGNRTADPCCREVLTFYTDPAMEFFSMPRDVDQTNLRRFPVPELPMDAADEVIHPDDIYIGHTEQVTMLTYSLLDLYLNMAVGGVSGSGKTNFMRMLNAQIARRSMRNSLGMKISLVVFENKGKGAYDNWDSISYVPGARMIEVTRGDAPIRLALEGRRIDDDGVEPGDVVRSVNKFVAHLRRAFGDGIKGQSREILEAGIAIAMLLTESERRQLFAGTSVDLNFERPNVIELAHLVIGGMSYFDPRERLNHIYKKIESEVFDPRTRALTQNIGILSPHLSRKNDQLLAPPRNKLSDLMKATGLFSTDGDRTEVYIEEVVNSFAPTVINVGPYKVEGTSRYENEMDALTQRTCVILISDALWSYAKDHNNGWKDENKLMLLSADEAVLFAPELSDNDGGIDSIPAEISEQGRTLGCAMILGFQDFVQMPKRLSHKLQTFQNRITSKLTSLEDAKIVNGLLGDVESPYSIKNIQSIPVGTSFLISMAHRDSRGQVKDVGPFTLHTPEMTPGLDNLLRKYDAVELTDRIRKIETANRHKRYAKVA